MITLKTIPFSQESFTYRLIRDTPDHHLKVTVKITHYDSYEFHDFYFFRGTYSPQIVKQRIEEEEYYASESARYRVRYTLADFEYLPTFNPVLPLPVLKDNEEYRVDVFYRDNLTDALLYMYAYMGGIKTASDIQNYFKENWSANTEIINVSVVMSSSLNNDGNF
jgi:hypothetical protein